jgi:hypothetical protein
MKDLTPGLRDRLWGFGLGAALGFRFVAGIRALSDGLVG